MKNTMRKERTIMNRYCCLSDIEPGEQAVVCEILSEEHMRRRLCDMGLIEDTCLQCLGRSRGGAISAYYIRGAVIAIRCEDCDDILVRPLEEDWEW